MALISALMFVLLGPAVTYINKYLVRVRSYLNHGEETNTAKQWDSLSIFLGFCLFADRINLSLSLCVVLGRYGAWGNATRSTGKTYQLRA